MRKRFKNKPQNRMRIVFREEQGVPVSYMHIERSEARNILRAFEEVSNNSDWQIASKLAKRMGISRMAFVSLLSKMAGALYVDLMDENKHYKKILIGPLICIKKGRENGLVMSGIKPPHHQPPIYIKSCGGKLVLSP